MFPAAFKLSVGDVPRQKDKHLAMFLMINCMTPRWYNTEITELKKMITGNTWNQNVCYMIVNRTTLAEKKLS